MPKPKNEKWYSFQMKSGVAKIRIYQEIGYFGINAEDFLNDLDGIDESTPMEIYINSPGGSITEGNAMYSALARMKNKKTVYIDGVAASMASVLAMVAHREGDKVVMAENAFFMIHNPYSFAMGGSTPKTQKNTDSSTKLTNTKNPKRR